MASTLNVFQRLARQWDQIHPYNAAQILQIKGAPDLEALQNAWHDAMDDLGLGRVHLRGRNFYYECLNGEMVHYGVRVAAPGVTLEDHVSDQLNKPFDNPAEPPFRPFVVVGDGSYHAGIIYHHWVADSVSIRTLLREWFVRVYDPSRARKEPVRLPDAGYRSFFGLGRGAAAVGQGVLAAARWASSLRRARRFEEKLQPDFSVRFAVRHAQPGFLTPILEGARRQGVTLNDLFMAAIARVCDAHVPLKHRPRRHSLALGSIVDLRPYSHGSLQDTFGLFLGFTNVVCRPAELREPRKLLKSIALQNHHQKQRGMPQASALRMLAGVTLGNVMGRDVVHFYHKHLPLAGGISNVNLNRCWATGYHPDPLMDYIRVSPTGPMMPLVFATTTLGDTFHFALTYRPSVVNPAKLEPMTRMFLSELANLAG